MVWFYHVGGVADQVTAWPRRPMVCRSPEANSGGNGQSAETAGRHEEGKTIRENLAKRRCPCREKRWVRTGLVRRKEQGGDDADKQGKPGHKHNRDWKCCG